MIPCVIFVFVTWEPWLCNRSAFSLCLLVQDACRNWPVNLFIMSVSFWVSFCLQNLLPSATPQDAQQWLLRNRFSPFCRLFTNFSGKRNSSKTLGHLSPPFVLFYFKNQYTASLLKTRLQYKNVAVSQKVTNMSNTQVWMCVAESKEYFYINLQFSWKTFASKSKFRCSYTQKRHLHRNSQFTFINPSWLENMCKLNFSL